MNSFRRRDAAPDSVPNAIVGAARRVHIDRREEVQALRERGIDERQMLAWRYYDAIGEIKAAYNYFAAVGSRIRFYAGFQPDGASNPSPIGEVGNLDRSLVTAARYELAKLNNGRGGQPSFIRAMILNLLVAGECYIVGSNGKWSVRSTSEVRFEQDNKVRLVISRYQRGTYMHYLPEDAFIARVWRMHPQYSDDADASMHGVLGECSELLLVNRLIRASVRSRLSAGLLYVADELRFQKSGDPDSDLDPDIDPFEEELTLALTDPIGDSDSPSEIVPLIIRGPSQFSESGIKLIDLGRNFDPALITRHDQTLTRILQGLEIPQDMVSGFSKVRYSNVQAVSQDFLKSYLEPMAVLIAEAITTVFLRPALIARGFNPELVDRVQVWYDSAAVVLKPDKSDAADNGYKQMLVSGASWRRAHGFTDADAPDPTEIVRRVGLQGAVPPNAIVDMMRELAPQLVEKAERMAGHSMDQPVPGTNMDSMVPLGGDAKNPPSTDTNPSRNPALPSGGPGGNHPGSGVPGPRAKHGQDPMSNIQPVSAKPPTTKPTATPPPPEGHLPSRAGQASLNDEGTMHVEAERLDTGAIMEMLQALTAAAAAPDNVRDIERRLDRALQVERRLRDQLSVHLNDVVRRALERAGARTVSKIRGEASLKTLVMDVPIEEAFASVPADRRATFDLDDDRLLRDTIEHAAVSFTRLLIGAQKNGWLHLGVSVSAEMAGVQKDFVARAWDWLFTELLSLAKHFLHRPKKDDSNYVPMAVIRDAMTLAGGGEHEGAPEHSAAPRSRPQDSGRAVLSAKALDTMAETEGVTFARRYRWVYGISDNHFEPHLALDGHVFDSWESGALAATNAGEWPFTSHYYPGDHNGCRCDWLPEVLDVAAVNKAEQGDTHRIAASGG